MKQDIIMCRTLLVVPDNFLLTELVLKESDGTFKLEYVHWGSLFTLVIRRLNVNDHW